MVIDFCSNLPFPDFRCVEPFFPVTLSTDFGRNFFTCGEFPARGVAEMLVQGMSTLTPVINCLNNDRISRSYLLNSLEMG